MEHFSRNLLFDRETSEFEREEESEIKFIRMNIHLSISYFVRI